MFVAFSVTLGYSISLEGMLTEGRTLVRLSLPSFASLEAMSTMEPKEPETWMVGR